jgi:hypothetical protein
MWYYCAVDGESKKIVFTSGRATSHFWSPTPTSENNF